jgi:hypothetical protein
VYCFDGEVIGRAISFPGPGQKHLALLQLTYDQGQPNRATAELIDTIFRDRRDEFAAYKRLLLALARADGRVAPDPNPEVPAAPAPPGAAA